VPVYTVNENAIRHRRIVEVLDEEEVTISGIVLPDTAREKPQRVMVGACG
jgi:co-chaperonin GroES (HSP10)